MVEVKQQTILEKLQERIEHDDTIVLIDRIDHFEKDLYQPKKFDCLPRVDAHSVSFAVRPAVEIGDLDVLNEWMMKLFVESESDLLTSVKKFIVEDGGYYMRRRMFRLQNGYLRMNEKIGSVKRIEHIELCVDEKEVAQGLGFAHPVQHYSRVHPQQYENENRFFFVKSLWRQITVQPFFNEAEYEETQKQTSRYCMGHQDILRSSRAFEDIIRILWLSESREQFIQHCFRKAEESCLKYGGSTQIYWKEPEIINGGEIIYYDGVPIAERSLVSICPEPFVEKPYKRENSTFHYHGKFAEILNSTKI